MAIGSIQAGVAAAQSAMPQRSQQLGQSIQDASATAAAAFAGIMQRKQAEEDRIDQTKGALKQSYYGGETVTEDNMYDGHYKVLDAMGNALISDEMISWAAESSENQGTWLGMLKQYQDKVASAENLYKTTSKEYQTAIASSSNPVELANLDKDGFQIDSGAAESFLNQQFLALHEDVAGKDSQVQIDMDDLKNGKLSFTVATPQSSSVVLPTGDEEVSFGPGAQGIKLDQQDLGALSFEKEENLTAFNLVRNGLITEKPPLTIDGALVSNSFKVVNGLKGDELEANIVGAMDADEFAVLNWFFNSTDETSGEEATREEINSILQNRDNPRNAEFIKKAREEFLEMYKDSYIDQGRGEKAPKFTGTTVQAFKETMGGTENVIALPRAVRTETVQLMVGGAAQPVQIMDIDFRNPEDILVTLNMGDGAVIKKASELGGVDAVLQAVRQAINNYTTDRAESNRLLKAFNQLVDI